MEFQNTLPEWKNEGVEPTTELKENGFVAGYKPPASIFNWFLSLVSKAITELQTKLSSLDTTLTEVKRSVDSFTISNATAEKDGLMSKEDKAKLDLLGYDENGWYYYGE